MTRRDAHAFLAALLFKPIDPDEFVQETESRNWATSGDPELARALRENDGPAMARITDAYWSPYNQSRLGKEYYLYAGRACIAASHPHLSPENTGRANRIAGLIHMMFEDTD